MLLRIQKYWPLISILFILAILISIFSWPAGVRSLSRILLIISLGMAIAFTIQRHTQAYRQGRLGRTKMLSSMCLDVVIMIATMVVVLLAAGQTAAVVGQFANEATESIWPGKGAVAGIIASVLAALLVGLGIGFLIRLVSRLLTRHKRSLPTVNHP